MTESELIKADPVKSFADWSGQPLSKDQAGKHLEEFRARQRLLEELPSADVPPSREAEVHLKARADDLAQETAQKMGFKPVPFWPEGRPYALCVTHDIDRVSATYHRLKEVSERGPSALLSVIHDVATTVMPGMRELNPFFNFGRIAALEGELGVRSAFYVLFEKPRWSRAFQRREWQHVLGVYEPESIEGELKFLSKAGHEIGLHASFDSWNDSRAMKLEVGRLKRMGLSVSGARTHYLQFDHSQTPEVIGGAGLRYDSSIGFNLIPGFRAGTCFPYRLGPVWELPMHLMDTALRCSRPDTHSRKSAAYQVRDEVRRQGGVLVVNWHSQIMNADAFPQWVGLLRDLILEARAHGAWITTPQKLIGHWEERACRA